MLYTNEITCKWINGIIAPTAPSYWNFAAATVAKLNFGSLNSGLATADSSFGCWVVGSSTASTDSVGCFRTIVEAFDRHSFVPTTAIGSGSSYSEPELVVAAAG